MAKMFSWEFADEIPLTQIAKEVRKSGITNVWKVEDGGGEGCLVIVGAETEKEARKEYVRTHEGLSAGSIANAEKAKIILTD